MSDKRPATELWAALVEGSHHGNEPCEGCEAQEVSWDGYPKLLAAAQVNACEDGNDPDLPCCVARRALADARAALLEALDAV